MPSSLGASAKHGQDCDQVARNGRDTSEPALNASRLSKAPGKKVRNSEGVSDGVEQDKQYHPLGCRQFHWSRRGIHELHRCDDWQCPQIQRVSLQ